MYYLLLDCFYLTRCLCVLCDTAISLWGLWQFNAWFLEKTVLQTLTAIAENSCWTFQTMPIYGRREIFCMNKGPKNSRKVFVPRMHARTPAEFRARGEPKTRRSFDLPLVLGNQVASQQYARKTKPSLQRVARLIHKTSCGVSRVNICSFTL